MNIRPFHRSVWVVGILTLGGAALPPVARAGQITFSSPAPRDQPPPPRVGTGVLKGMVVDGVSGSPVARARVRISGGGGQRPSVMTDPSGGFTFTGLPGGAYTVSVEKLGYQPASYPERGRGMRSTTRPLVLQEGQTLDAVTVSIHRGGVIAGRVVDANGDPMEFVQIRALKVASGARGGARPMNSTSTSTNDLGEFRLSRLETGSYLVMAMPQRLGFREEPGPDGKPEVPPQPAPTYYPSVVSADLAQPIAVQRGQTVPGIDIIMGEERMGVIAGTVVDASGQPAGTKAMISINHVSRDGSGSGGSSTQVRPDGTFRAVVPPGDYSVEASLDSKAGSTDRMQADLFAAESVTLTSGASETLILMLGKGATVTGRVVFEGTSPLPANLGRVRVPLTSPNGRGCGSTQAEIAADWSFKMEGLIGTCTGPMSSPLVVGRWMLKAVLVDGEDLMDRPVTFKAGQQYRNVQVVFTDRRSEILFRVSDETGQPTREYVALVMPADRTRWPVSPNNYQSPARAFVPPQAEQMMFTQGASQASGLATARTPTMPAPPRREVMGGLRPGEYLAIAVDNIEPDETRDTALLEKLAAAATRVTLADGASHEVTLRRVTVAEVIR